MMTDELAIRKPDPMFPALRGGLGETGDDRCVAASTARAYRRDWEAFAAWCADRGLDDPLLATPNHVAGYVADLVDAGRAAATIRRTVTSLSVGYKTAGREPSPAQAEVVRRALAAARRRLGTAQRKARPVATVELERLTARCPDSLQGARDRAIILVGFAAALRRSELVALDVADLVVNDRGLEISIRRSKTARETEGAVVPVARGKMRAVCPVAAWTDWLAAAGLTAGPAFRRIDRHGHLHSRLTAAAVPLILTRAAQRAGLDLSALSAHSLRSGYVTTAAQRGHNERAIARVSRHRSLPVLRGYIHAADIWSDSATDLGL
jgi:site-specific recombinase XerD